MEQSPTTSTSDRPRNLALEFLAQQFENVEDYDEFCGELVDGIIHWLGEERVSILHIDAGDGLILRAGDPWRYHMVPIVDGNVHDAWYPHLVLPPEEYVKRAFPGQVLSLSFYGDKQKG